MLKKYIQGNTANYGYLWVVGGIMISHFFYELSTFLYHICFCDQRQIIKKYMNKESELCISEFENMFPGHTT